MMQEGRMERNIRWVYNEIYRDVLRQDGTLRNSIGKARVSQLVMVWHGSFKMDFQVLYFATANMDGMGDVKSTLI